MRTIIATLIDDKISPVIISKYSISINFTYLVLVEFLKTRSKPDLNVIPRSSSEHGCINGRQPAHSSVRHVVRRPELVIEKLRYFVVES